MTDDQPNLPRSLEVRIDSPPSVELTIEPSATMHQIAVYVADRYDRSLPQRKSLLSAQQPTYEKSVVSCAITREGADTPFLVLKADIGPDVVEWRSREYTQMRMEGTSAFAGKYYQEFLENLARR